MGSDLHGLTAKVGSDPRSCARHQVGGGDGPAVARRLTAAWRRVGLRGGQSRGTRCGRVVAPPRDHAGGLTRRRPRQAVEARGIADSSNAVRDATGSRSKYSSRLSRKSSRARTGCHATPAPMERPPHHAPGLAASGVPSRDSCACTRSTSPLQVQIQISPRSPPRGAPSSTTPVTTAVVLRRRSVPTRTHPGPRRCGGAHVPHADAGTESGSTGSASGGWGRGRGRKLAKRVRTRRAGIRSAVLESTTTSTERVQRVARRLDRRIREAVQQANGCGETKAMVTHRKGSRPQARRHAHRRRVGRAPEGIPSFWPLAPVPWSTRGSVTTARGPRTASRAMAAWRLTSSVAPSAYTTG